MKMDFDSYYNQIWGERWPALKDALVAEKTKTSVTNPFHKTHPKLIETFDLDPASLVVAKGLGVQSGDHVLDLCAAPGAKSVNLVFDVLGDATFEFNDTSTDRLKRLRAILHDFIPDEVRTRIKISNHDGTKWGLFHKEEYDKILLDAPCSGERSLLKNQTELKAWTPRRGEHLAHRQYPLLCAAWTSLKEGGRLIYATCTVNPVENEKVIAKFIKKKVPNIEFIKLNFETAEDREYGQMILPDKSNGAGPMYFCLMQKVPGSFSG